MSRLAPLDKALILILVPLWLVCFALGVRNQVLGGPLAVSGLGLTVEDAESYPALTGEFFRAVHPSDPLVEAGLLAGDRVIQVGSADMRGVGSMLAFSAVILDEAGRNLSVPLVLERNGERLEPSFPLTPNFVVRPYLVVAFAFAASALFLLLRGRPTPSVLVYFYLAMSFVASTWFPATGRALYVYVGVLAACASLSTPLAIRFAQLFPDDRAPENRWQRIWPWLFAFPSGMVVFLTFGSPTTIAQMGFMGVTAVNIFAILAVATRTYRAADRVARRQMKWVVFGAWCSLLPWAVAAALSALDPGLGWLFSVGFGGISLFPLLLVVSVVRFNLYDIDRLLSAAASYNVLAVLLAAGALVVVPRIAEAASGLVGVDPGTGQVVLSLGLAALVIPAHRRLRPQIDRVFFKERYAVDHGIAELLPTLSACTDARELTERAGTGLHDVLRPETLVVYAGAEQSYAPVFVEGRAVPPAFEADSPLIGTLRGRRAALSLSDAGRRPDEAPLGPFDRAALETLGAEVVVPVQRDAALTAFLCLGPKRSGDVYTSTDLSLLTAVAEKVSTELHRFDQDETVREAREMQESLRRYVPGAVAEQLASGGDLSSGEREVSVLFVDIRGYTGFAERREAEEIFSTINRYTETVSQIVQEHAGSVVEFNGDGMMAVFGAPRKIAHKERAAVEAGREIVEAVGALPIDGNETLSVGVGIATGEAFVGNIQAVDRMIWSAIGNTTNLAARLQSLTKELDASLVIDATTHERAQSAAEGFERRADVPIRGRRDAQDLYALPVGGIDRVSRLAALDRVLLLIVLPIWVVCFFFSVKTQMDGGGYAFIGLTVADADSYPVFNGEPASQSHLFESGLRPGDVLLRAGGTDLRGMNGLDFFLHGVGYFGSQLSLPVLLRRDGEEREIKLRLRPLSNFRPWVVSSLPWVASAVFLLLRARPTRTVRAYFHLALALGFLLGAVVGGGWIRLQISAQCLWIPLLLRFAMVFPDDRPPESRLHRWWPWFFAVIGPIFIWTHASGNWPVGQPLYMGTIGIGLAAVLATHTWKYRRADAVARRQFRWVLVGAYLTALPLAVTTGLLALDPRFEPLWLASIWLAALFPVFLIVSVVRFNLFDVDRVLSAAASYNVLALVLGAGALIAVPRIAEAASGLVGIAPGTSQVILSLLLVALVIPAHRRLRPQIDRVFFKERYAVDHGIAELLPALSSTRDARGLTQRVGDGLVGLLRPEACVVYAAASDGYAPVFAEGRAVPPAFAASSPLVGTLLEHRSPLSLSDVGRRPDEAPLGPFDRAALETLHADVVVPVRLDDALAAFLCLGSKRSGDVYTSTDLSLLSAVAEAVSQQLRRFDQEETTREAREMQESLRRYVPGAIAEQLGSGAELTSGEREVSVLFVDIRGYTGFAESRAAEEIFSTVNRYTEAVSRIVHEHGGSVVEFNGDGMMAVFGAPRELADKERAAVEAGREIVEAVGALPVEGEEALSVGAGIATGEAFVGNIEAVDRMIWSAIGNTTNLAARLQSLTRELDASVVIDASTWERAQPAAEDFAKKPDVPIRGRRESQDVYALPMRSR